MFKVQKWWWHAILRADLADFTLVADGIRDTSFRTVQILFSAPHPIARHFEGLITLRWYVEPLHVTAVLDFMGAAAATAQTHDTLVYLALPAILAVAALAGRQRKLLT